MSATVSYLGPAGTFTEAALWKFAETGVFRRLDITPLPSTNPREAIDAVRDGVADFACVAIENSVDGPVTPTFDAIAAGSGVHIYAELDLPIAFAMMLKPNTQLSQVRRVATHPVAYQQVKAWLAETIGEHEFIPASSNAAAAQLVAEDGADLAAAPTRSADLFGLHIVADNIADVAGARTRFVVVGPSGQPPQPTGVDRTAVVFTLRNEPGSLVAALTEFAVRGVDLSRIESRPIETGLGTYRFHVDINGHIADPLVAEALRALYTHCDSIRFLGSWPVAEANDRELELHQHKQRLSEADAWVKAAAAGQEREKD